ncbi:MAG: hypothetical protein WA254_17110 [Candidatus Sulfotelmatobacter sp.]
MQYVDRLENSHYLPAGVYRILRDDREKNPHPWLLNGRTAVQVSWQMTAPLLCRECEQRLSKHGENWVLKHCLRKNGTFPLASLLASKTPDLSSPENPTRIYYASRIPEINILALAYFAASIFWRGSIHPWNDDGSIPVELGPFQEQFRRYLMGLQAFPKDSSLWVMVREGKEIDRLTYAPVGERKGNFHVYKFPMPGLAFLLTVSKNIPVNHREICFVHGVGNPIIVTSVIDRLLVDDAVKMRQKSVRLPG